MADALKPIEEDGRRSCFAEVESYRQDKPFPIGGHIERSFGQNIHAARQ
jgi:hypothetical protein